MPGPRNAVLSGVDPLTRARTATIRALRHLDELERARYGSQVQPIVTALDGVHGATANLMADLVDLDNVIAVHLHHLGITESELRAMDGNR